MEVKVNEESYKTKGAIFAQFYRTIVRRKDEWGEFRRLN